MSIFITLDSVSGSAEFDDASMAELIDVDELDVADLARANGEIVDKDFVNGRLQFIVQVDLSDLTPDLEKARELIEKELESESFDLDISCLTVCHEYDNVFSFDS